MHNHTHDMNITFIQPSLIFTWTGNGIIQNLIHICLVFNYQKQHNIYIHVSVKDRIKNFPQRRPEGGWEGE